MLLTELLLKPKKEKKKKKRVLKDHVSTSFINEDEVIIAKKHTNVIK